MKKDNDFENLSTDIQVDHCKKYAEISGVVNDLEDIIKDINEEYRQSLKKPSSSIIKLFGGAVASLILYYFLFDNDLSIASMLLIVIFIHELGHFVMQKIYGFRNVIMRFVGIGGYVLGVSKNNSSSENFWMIIMGPLPGILVSLFFFAYSPSDASGMVFINILFLLNALNLFPAGFLDGGKIFSICFDRYPRFSWIMSIVLYVPLILMLGISFLDSFEDGILGILMILFPLILFVLHFASLLNNRDVIIKKESAKLSRFLIRRYGFIPNRINLNIASYIWFNLEALKKGNQIYIGDVWHSRLSPLTNLTRILFICIYISLVLTCVFIFNNYY